MKIGFDVSQTGMGAGCGFFAYAMICAMLKIAPEHSYVLFPTFGDFFFEKDVELVQFGREANIVHGPRQQTVLDASRFWRSRDLEERLGSLDLIHANNYWCPRQLMKTPLVYTAYDLSFLEEPSWTTEANRVGCFAGIFDAAVAADWIIAISQYTREHFLRTFPVFPEERIEVIYPASRFTDPTLEGNRPIQCKDLQPGHFWLSVGTLEPRKNQQRLVEAYSRYVALGGPRMPLVIAGGPGWLMESFPKQIAASDVAEDVLITGFVTDEELVWLYRSCYAHVYVSHFEGFGLPILEGMQFGAPSIASQTTSMPEIVGDAGVLVNPTETDEICQALLELALNPGRREEFAAKAQKRAAQFDWKQSVRRVLNLYERAVSQPKRVFLGDRCDSTNKARVTQSCGPEDC